MQTVLLRRSLGLQEQVGLREGQHNRTAKAQPFMQHVCSPDGGMQLHSSGTGCSDNQPQREDASTTGSLVFLSCAKLPAYFPPPIERQRDSPCCCRDPHELQQPRSQGCRKMSPLRSAPRSFPKECTCSCHLQVFATVSAQSSSLASNMFSFRSN